ncbi:hypothetical protein DSM106972_058690 [Dulcicalothrix desertica PCC 7102]|uniref:ARC6 IMS domain-containing protein n=1 Tax=Dulcicalothrix desertica PCC 7102 TaxID=232991 RepID=A0A433V8G8_9CYAN|nr:hypothetical protein [Dulcicalothrix desertica]RUT02391.1 hypothetical protein DSM106972_058690 [Dulcicalothrix desertica PCC 7102]TWH55390.1 hypothetical protein CAL7102_03519 [Dulcicalothrix desertica PCC 7102]
MNTLHKLIIFPLIVLLISACNALNAQSLTGNQANSSSDKCPDKPTGSLNINKVEKIQLSSQPVTKSAQVQAGQYLGYTFTAESGQKLNRETKENICIWVYAPDNQIITGKDLLQRGRYIIQVTAPQGYTAFDLKLSLESPATSNSSSDDTNKQIATSPPSATESSSVNTNIPISRTESLPATTNNTSRPSPEKVVEDYFVKINNKEFLDAWNILTTQAQDNKQYHPNGFNSFLEWYRDTVDYVNIQNIALVQSNQDVATVNFRSRYNVKYGKIVPVNLMFYMRWNEEKQNWAINRIQVLK